MGSGIGGTVADIMGGQDEYYQATPKTDLDKYEYGDSRGANTWMGQGDVAQGRSAAQINGAPADQMRNYALGSRDASADALSMMGGAARGEAPSVAMQQLQMGRDQALQNSMAMANSVRGGGANLAASQMAAQRQQGEMMGQVNQQAAQLRAGEMATARQQYGQMAAAQRAQDLQAQGLDFQSAQAQAQMEMQQHGLNDQYSMGMYGLGQHSADQAQMGSIKGQEDMAGNQLAAGQINAGVAGINAGAASQGGSQALGTAAGIAGGMMMMSDARLKSGVHSVGSDDPRQTRLKQLMDHMGGGGNDAYARGLAMGSQLGSAMGSAFASRAPDPGVSEGTKSNAVMGGGAAPATDVNDLVARNGGGAWNPVMMSDARLKQGVGSAGGNPVDHFLGSLHPVAYHYKEGVPGEDPRQPRYGILAQDVAQSPMGRSVVENTQMGMGINVPHATGALMAGEGELYERQKRLEAQLHAMRGGR